MNKFEFAQHKILFVNELKLGPYSKKKEKKKNKLELLILNSTETKPNFRT